MEKGTVNLPIDEYDRLKQIERDMQLLMEQSSDTVIVEDLGCFRHRIVYRANDYVKSVLMSNASLQRELANLKRESLKSVKPQPWYKRLLD